MMHIYVIGARINLYEYQSGIWCSSSKFRRSIGGTPGQVYLEWQCDMTCRDLDTMLRWKKKY